MKKPIALVTGAAGFLGSHVVDHLLRQNFEVVGLDDLSGGFRENVSSQAKFVTGSVTAPEVVDALFEAHRFDYVFHLAAYAAEGLSHFIRGYNYTTNLLGSIYLINAAVRHEVKCFVFTSSIAVYGPGQAPMSEDMMPLPEDPYGVSKYAVELDLEAAHRMFGLNYIVFRPHNVYGERQNIADRYRNVIGIFMNQVMKNQPMTIFGDGRQTRAFSHVDDVAPVIAQSVTVTAAYNQVFNVGADKPYTVLELAHEVARAFGVAPAIRHLEARQEVLHAFSKHDKVQRTFCPPTPIGLREGVERMAAWAKLRPPMEPTVFSAIEVTKNLPASWRIAK